MEIKMLLASVAVFLLAAFIVQTRISFESDSSDAKSSECLPNESFCDGDKNSSQNLAVDLKTEIASGSMFFAIDVYRRLKRDQENLVVSPLSLTMAMSMVLMGSRGRTSEEISKALFGNVIPPEQFDLLAYEYESFIGRTLENNKNVLSVSNFMYSQLGFGLRKDFQQLLQKHFAAKAVEVDFGNRRETVDTINQDISQATENKISQILREEDISEATRLLLANTVYFKGLWWSKFLPNNTKKETFTLSTGEKVQVDMMYQKSKQMFTYIDELECLALSLPFGDSSISMVLLLPYESKSLKEVESKLTAKLFEKILDRFFHSEEVEIWLPKFKIESKRDLIPVLKELGVNDLFTESSDLSGMSESSVGLLLSDMIEHTVIEVNEKGAEAVGIRLICVKCSMPKKREFRADHPFLFFLVDYNQKKDLILFMGAVEDPRN